MRHFQLWNVQNVAVFLSITYMCHIAGCISIRSAQRNLSRSVQEDALFSVDVSSTGVPTVQWTFMSGAESRFIGTWQPGGDTNLTADYSSRVKAYENGSMVLLDLRLQDTGFYLLTVTEEAGSSKDVGFVLKVNEVLYEDLQYLSITALALGVVAALLMLVTWLLHKACMKVKAWRHRRRMPEKDETELQRLETQPVHQS
uniref:Immunoglobulin V-set domain-containing protein n=1 Tax=Oryzias latipes TaxID=8090 RepID=A0A3P9LGQ8_ORYLA